jgi:hypothetical protein
MHAVAPRSPDWVLPQSHGLKRRFTNNAGEYSRGIVSQSKVKEFAAHREGSLHSQRHSPDCSAGPETRVLRPQSLPIRVVQAARLGVEPRTNSDRGLHSAEPCGRDTTRMAPRRDLVCLHDRCTTVIWRTEHQASHASPLCALVRHTWCSAWTRASFVGPAKHEFAVAEEPGWSRVALCSGNGRMNGWSLFTLARASRLALQPGPLVPAAE